MTLLFQNLLYFSMIHDYVTMTYDLCVILYYAMWQFVIVIYIITLISEPKFKKIKIKIKNKK